MKHLLISIMLHSPEGDIESAVLWVNHFYEQSACVERVEALEALNAGKPDRWWCVPRFTIAVATSTRPRSRPERISQ